MLNMKDLNLELLNDTYLRVVKLFKKYSKLELSTLCHNKICLKSYTASSDYNQIYFKNMLNAIHLSADKNKYTFLLEHDFCRDLNDHSYGCSIFKYIESLKYYFDDYIIKYYSSFKNVTINYEVYKSEAFNILKNMGFPESLEELDLKLTLVGC